MVSIDLSRDSLFDSLGLIRLRESYMLENEKSPQERFAFVAEKFGSNPEHAQRIYEYASFVVDVAELPLVDEICQLAR